MAEDGKLRQGRGDIKQPETGADKYKGRTNQDDRQHRTQGLALVYPGHTVLDTCDHNRKGGQCHERACAKEHASNDPVTRPDLLYLVWLDLAARGRAKHSIPIFFLSVLGCWRTVLAVDTQPCETTRRSGEAQKLLHREVGKLHDLFIRPQIMLFSCFSVEGGLGLLTL